MLPGFSVGYGWTDWFRLRGIVLYDLTGGFCTSGSEREFTLEGSWYAHEEIQAGADRDTAEAG
jgi:hypothetical protein